MFVQCRGPQAIETPCVLLVLIRLYSVNFCILYSVDLNEIQTNEKGTQEKRQSRFVFAQHNIKATDQGFYSNNGFIALFSYSNIFISSPFPQSYPDENFNVYQLWWFIIS